MLRFWESNDMWVLSFLRGSQDQSRGGEVRVQQRHLKKGIHVENSPHTNGIKNTEFKHYDRVICIFTAELEKKKNLKAGYNNASEFSSLVYSIHLKSIYLYSQGPKGFF